MATTRSHTPYEDRYAETRLWRARHNEWRKEAVRIGHSFWIFDAYAASLEAMVLRYD